MLLTLLLVQVPLSASMITSEAPPVGATAGEEAPPANKPLLNPPPPAAKLSYAMMDVGGYAVNDSSWQQLLLETRTNISDILKDGTRVKLKFQDAICGLSPTCDTVNVVKTVDSNVVRYEVYITCETKGAHKFIDASEMRAVAKRVARIIGAHDKEHELQK